MRAVWLTPLLLCFILSSANAAGCNYAGCKSCNAQDKCIACERGWNLQDYNCYMCGSGCDKCTLAPLSGGRFFATCIGSCQNGCITCNPDYTCAKCPKEFALYKGQCFSCGDSCSKCEVFQESWSGDLILNKCTGYCGGGCNSCAGDGLTCNECRKGYALIQGKCWPCPTGCNKCIAGQMDMFYRGWSTSCIDATSPPDPTPTPTPTPTPAPAPSNNNNNNNNQSSTGSQSFTYIAVFVIIFGLAAFILTKKNKENQRANVQQDYAQAMAAEKQRQAALTIPSQNYQYQPPQAYSQGYPQGNQPAQPRF